MSLIYQDVRSMIFTTTKPVFVFFCFFAWNCQAQDSNKLFNEIAKVDTEFFQAFNVCDLDKMGDMFSKGLEFYHDTGGVADYKQTMDSTKSNCDKKLGLKRKLVKGSMKVYPIHEFGAIQKGKHQFCHRVNGKNDCGIFEFVHLWKKQGNAWKLFRVISYDH